MVSELVLIWGLLPKMPSLNPYSIGRWFLREQGGVVPTDDISLNPYSIGRWLLSGTGLYSRNMLAKS